MDIYRKAAHRISQSRYAVALTGAGISVESGIPDFRSAGGLWSRYDPMEFGHIDSFRADPGKVWKMLLDMDKLLRDAKPNPAHGALAELERRGILKAVITQNVDSLHQKAGSRFVIEYHGHNRTLRCDGCGLRVNRESVALERIPPRCACGGPLRPDFVFFGEDIPPEAHARAVLAAESCDLMIVIGTSATVAPASQLPLMARQGGAFILEINPDATALTGSITDLHIAESAAGAMRGIMAMLEK